MALESLSISWTLRSFGMRIAGIKHAEDTLGRTEKRVSAALGLSVRLLNFSHTLSGPDPPASDASVFAITTGSIFSSTSHLRATHTTPAHVATTGAVQDRLAVSMRCAIEKSPIKEGCNFFFVL